MTDNDTLKVPQEVSRKRANECGPQRQRKEKKQAENPLRPVSGAYDKSNDKDDQATCAENASTNQMRQQTREATPRAGERERERVR